MARKITLGQVQKAWRIVAPKRKYHFGFNLTNLLPDGNARIKWFKEARKYGIKDLSGIVVAVYFSPRYLNIANKEKFGENYGIQDIHAGAGRAEQILKDFPVINAVLISNSEDQAAKQLRKALDSTIDGRTFKFITLCVGEEREMHTPDTDVGAVFGIAKIKPEEMPRIGIAYEPGCAVRDEHIRTIGWSILKTVAEAVGLDGMSKMFALQYGGRIKGSDDMTDPVQRFIGPRNKVSKDLFNGGLVGSGSEDPKTIYEILKKAVNFS